MLSKKTFVILFVFLSFTGFSQSNFSFSPQNPKPGDLITISYEPAGDIAASLKPVEGAFHILGYAPNGYKNIATDELRLTREGKKYSASIQTDTASHFIYLSFSSDKKFDNNYNNGYYIILNKGDKPARGAYNALAMFYQYMGRDVGIEVNNEKALTALEKEISLYPEDRKNYINQYFRLMNILKKPDAAALLQKEIESLLKEGLKSEDDYQTIESLYITAKLPEQSKMISSIKKEKYPQGKWTVNEYIRKFRGEMDATKSETMLKEIVEKIKNDPNWKNQEPSIENYMIQPLNVYYSNKDWAGLSKVLPLINIKSQSQLASFYNNAAWEMQKTNADLKLAEELSRKATLYAKTEMTRPTEKKPAYLTTKEWERNRKFNYAQYGDTYAMVLYRMGDYKNAYKYTKEAVTISERKDVDHNNTYALVAEKLLPVKQYKKELEQFVKDGKAGPDVKEVLKRIYAKEKGSEEGYENYIAALQKEQYLKMLEELRKSMLNEASPSFALFDLDGNNVKLSEFKGKVVIVDFWATWCGPCKASFPAMQKMVMKYKENPEVKFVFVDTWEKADDKKKNAAEFISKNKYSFQVLMDDDDKVVEQFKVEGIPTKFVIDKNGIIRFKSVGFNGDDKLAEELTAMIDIASQQNSGTKTF